MRAITISRAEKLPIGELSRLSGVNIETIRYYEKIKILPAPPRTESGRRVYGPNEFRRLSFVRRSRELGFTIDEIRSLLALGAPGNASCREVREVATAHLEEIRTKIKDLVKLERLLANTIAQCSGRSVPGCPILDILDVQRSKQPTRTNRR
jgi:MerR family mercuric resistance operon transcriptional regulator